MMEEACNPTPTYTVAHGLAKIRKRNLVHNLEPTLGIRISPPEGFGTSKKLKLGSSSEQ